jgi:molecular chaperone Hsp33
VIEQDRLRRFLFEDAPVRGHWVRLARSWIDAREHQQLPPPAMHLLGEALAAAALLSASLKFRGTLTLQLAGSSGPVSMLVAQATDTRTLRGVAHVDEEAAISDAGFPALIKGGRMVVSVEQGGGASPWQGVVPLEAPSLAKSLESYFAVSEQLPTVIVLAADESCAAGLLLQKLPKPAAPDLPEAVTSDLWDEVTALVATVSAQELLATGPAELLGSLFAGHEVRLFDGESVQFGCRCDRERVSAMLRGLGREEVEGIIAEQGQVSVTCEFCRRPYVFDAVDAARLFLPGVDPEKPSLN